MNSTKALITSLVTNDIIKRFENGDYENITQTNLFSSNMFHKIHDSNNISWETYVTLKGKQKKLCMVLNPASNFPPIFNTEKIVSMKNQYNLKEVELSNIQHDLTLLTNKKIALKGFSFSEGEQKKIDQLQKHVDNIKSQLNELDANIKSCKRVVLQTNLDSAIKICNDAEIYVLD